jgi:hypothetical protein
MVHLLSILPAVKALLLLCIGSRAAVDNMSGELLEAARDGGICNVNTAIARGGHC